MWALAAAVLLAAFLGHSQSSFSSPAHAEDLAVGAALPSDMAAWPATGMVPIGHFGGVVRSIAAERGRPVVWAAVGPRVLAFEEAWDGLRLTGRSPALPGGVFFVAADAGRVLALVESTDKPIEAWLIDGRDPHWPRGARRLSLGERVAGIGVHGASGVVVADNDVVVLDLVNPAQPVEVYRTTVGTLDSERYMARLALDRRRLVVASPPLGVVVLDREPDGTLDPARRILASSGYGVELHGDTLLTIDADGQAISYDLSAPEGDFATVIDPDVTGVGAVASDGERVFTLDGAAGQHKASLRSYVPVADGTWRAEGERTFDHMPLGFPWAESPLTAGTAALHYAGTDGTRIFSLPKVSVRNPAAGAPSQWRPIVCQVDDLEHHGTRLLVGEWYGGLSLLDPESPERPQWLGRAARRPFEFPTPSRNVERMVVVEDQLWFVDRRTFRVVEVAEDGWGRELYVHDGSIEKGIAYDGQHVFVMGYHGLLVYTPRPGRAPELIGQLDFDTAQVLDIVVLDGHVWTVELEGFWDGQLQSIDVSVPREPRLAGTYRLDAAGVGLGQTDRHLLVVQHHPTGAITLHAFDPGNPASAREIGSVELSPANPDAARPYEATMAVDGADVLVVHPNVGVVRVDSTRPTRPEVIGRMALPNQAWRVTRDGPFAWVSVFFRGVLALRLDPLNQEPWHRLWLPSLTPDGM